MVAQKIRPHTTVVVAMSADGKIADRDRSAARFSSSRDRAHLEAQIAQTDAAIFGAGTLRAYHTSLPITNPEYINQRRDRGQPPQPIHIVCSASGNLDPSWRFFSQPFPRWLLTSPDKARRWQNTAAFDGIVTADYPFDWSKVLQQLATLGIQRLAILGGGQLIGALISQNLIDEFWLTLCPLILGGENAPTAVEGEGFWAENAKSLQLLSVDPVENEIFLHYRVQH
ncbi:MAG: RibD family protein [Spirulinaceae cyanobacterium]